MYDELPYIRAFVRQFGRRCRGAGQQSGKPISAHRVSPSSAAAAASPGGFGRKSRSPAVVGTRDYPACRLWRTHSIRRLAIGKTDRIIGVGPIHPCACARSRSATDGGNWRTDRREPVSTNGAAASVPAYSSCGCAVGWSSPGGYGVTIGRLYDETCARELNERNDGGDDDDRH
jgi:hypothetical protein